MTGGESVEERSLYLLSICLCVVPCATLSSLLFLETEEALLFWETKVKLPMLEMLSDLVFLGNLQVVHLIFINRLEQNMHTVQTFASCLERGCVDKAWGVRDSGWIGLLRLPTAQAELNLIIPLFRPDE